MTAPSDLENLVRLGHESKTLDYKGAETWDTSDKKACCELVKDILAFANSGGGSLVVGVSEAPAGYNWDGLSTDELKTWDSTKVNNFVANYADPPINCNVAKVTSQGATFVVVSVPGFPDVPHLCCKDYPGVLAVAALYIRSDANASEPLKTSSDFRALFERALQNRQQKIIESVRAVMKGSEGVQAAENAVGLFTKDLRFRQVTAADATSVINDQTQRPFNGFREAWAFPGRYELERFNLTDLQRVINVAGQQTYLADPFLHTANFQGQRPTALEHSIEARYTFKNFLKRESREYWQLSQSGLFVHRMLMEEEWGSRQPEMGLYLELKTTLRYIAQALNCVCTMFEGLMDPGEPITFGTRVGGCKGRHLIVFGSPVAGLYEAAIDEIRYERTRPLVDWRAGLVDHVIEATDHILQRFNVPGWDKSGGRQIVSDLFARRLS